MAVDTSKAIHKSAPKMSDKQMKQYVNTMKGVDAGKNKNKATNSKKRKIH